MFDATLLQGKRILITGGGTGLGKEMAVGFAAHGAHVYICGRRKEVLDLAVTEIRERSRGEAKALIANVRDPDSIEAMMAAIWADGPLTGLVNNAGANFLAPTETLSPRGYEAIRSTVMDGSFYASVACGRRWIAEGLPGVIISNLVTWIWTGSAYVVPAAMAKAAVHAMTMSLATEWGRYGIRLNAIAPGEIPTEGMSKRLNPGEEPGSRTKKVNPLGRVGTMEELENLATFLISGGCDWIFGETIALDGAQALATGAGFYELRNWSDGDWQAARERIEAQNKKDRAQRA